MAEVLQGRGELLAVWVLIAQVAEVSDHLVDAFVSWRRTRRNRWNSAVHLVLPSPCTTSRMLKKSPRGDRQEIAIVIS